MATAPQPADRDRWLALGLLAGALALAYLLLVHPWWTVPMLEANERVGELQQRELRQRMELRQAPDVRERLAQLQARQARAPGFLPESSAELATAALIQRLESVVATASPGNRSCVIQNRSPLTDPGRDRYPRVVVQVRLRCGTPELANVLHAIESGAPRLFVDNLNVLAQRYFFAPAAATGERTAREGGLDVSFDLYGYLPPPPGSAATTTEARRAR